jgi:hypothetical protein
MSWGDPYRTLKESYRSDLLQRSILGLLYFLGAGLVLLIAKEEKRTGTLIAIIAISFILAAYLFAFGFANIRRKVLVFAEFSDAKTVLQFHYFDRRTPFGRSIEEMVEWTEMVNFTVPFSSHVDDPTINVTMSYKRRHDQNVQVAELDFPSFTEAITFVSVLGMRFGFVEIVGTGFRKFIKSKDV